MLPRRWRVFLTVLLLAMWAAFVSQLFAAVKTRPMSKGIPPIVGIASGLDCPCFTQSTLAYIAATCSTPPIGACGPLYSLSYFCVTGPVVGNMGAWSVNLGALTCTSQYYDALGNPLAPTTISVTAVEAEACHQVIVKDELFPLACPH